MAKNKQKKRSKTNKTKTKRNKTKGNKTASKATASNPSLYAQSVEEFVQFYVVPSLEDPQSRRCWCANWAQHPEAWFVLDRLWRSFEEAYASDLPIKGGMGQCNWMTGHFYPLLDRLTHVDGAFGRCTPQRCAGIRELDGFTEAPKPLEPIKSDSKVRSPKKGKKTKKDKLSSKTAKKHRQKEGTAKSDRGWDRIACELGAKVFGQDQVIEPVARRLRITGPGLDLRPERPDGVFLFVGPSGCGKTELAYGIAEAHFGDRDAVIRLDMSEYSHWSDVSRLTGSAPGYTGNDQPQSWLTTRVINQPKCVVLLDEIEKAHPTVYPFFLQIFDAGRLTDGRGQTADFSKTVICMTSNLGSHHYGKAATGFSTGNNSGIVGSDPATRNAARSVESHFRPEFRNRLDHILYFNPLDRATLHQIVDRELTAAGRRLATAGYQLEFSESVVDHIVGMADRPEFGARQLHRLVENDVIASAVEQPKGNLLAANATVNPSPINPRLRITWQQVAS